MRRLSGTCCGMATLHNPRHSVSPLPLPLPWAFLTQLWPIREHYDVVSDLYLSVVAKLTGKKKKLFWEKD